MTLALQLRRDSLWSLAPLVVVTLLNIASVPWFVHSLGPERYALWAYVLTVSGSFGFMDLGVGLAVGRYVGVALGRRDAKAVREFWATGHAFALPILALMTAVYYLVGTLLTAHWFNVRSEDMDLMKATLATGALATSLGYYVQVWQILSQAHLDFRFLGLLRAGATALTIPPSMALAWWTRNPAILMGWAAFASVVQLAILVDRSRRRYGLGAGVECFSLARAREMLRFAFQSCVLLVTGSIFTDIDRLILGYFATPTQFSFYTVAKNVGSRLHCVGQSVMGPVFHNTSRLVGEGATDGPATVYDETFRFLLQWHLLALTWLAVWEREFLNVWLGVPLAAQVAMVFLPVFAGHLVRSLSTVSCAQLPSLGRQGTELFFTVSVGLLTAAGCLMGWRMDGLRGAAYGYLLAQFAWVAQDALVVLLVRGRGWFWWQTWKTVAAQVMVAGIFLGVKTALHPGIFACLALACVHGMLVAGYLLRGVLGGLKGATIGAERL